jgi:hypothetical protein
VVDTGKPTDLSAARREAEIEDKRRMACGCWAAKPYPRFEVRRPLRQQQQLAAAHNKERVLNADKRNKGNRKAIRKAARKATAQLYASRAARKNDGPRILNPIGAARDTRGKQLAEAPEEGFAQIQTSDVACERFGELFLAFDLNPADPHATTRLIAKLAMTFLPAFQGPPALIDRPSHDKAERNGVYLQAFLAHYKQTKSISKSDKHAFNVLLDLKYIIPDKDIADAEETARDSMERVRRRRMVDEDLESGKEYPEYENYCSPVNRPNPITGHKVINTDYEKHAGLLIDALGHYLALAKIEGERSSSQV